MTHSIFYSWQDDTPSKVGKRFLREVLEYSLRTTSENHLSEAERDEQQLGDITIESDTEGEAGQPPIVATILKKIDSASVVVADLTFTGKRIDGRPTPNANVLIEYGWALKALGYGRVITVMNEAYGEATRESLPFDLSHMRFPIRYSLPENADTIQRDKVKRELAGVIKSAIQKSISTISPEPTKEPEVFAEVQARQGPARFRAGGEEIGFYEGWGDGTSKKVYLKDGPALWVRLIPTKPLENTLSVAEIKKVATSQGVSFLPLAHGTGMDWLRAEDGWGIYPATNTSSTSNEIDTQGVAFVFETGELWSIDTLMLSGHKIVPFLEKILNRKLEDYILFMRALGIDPPYHWKVGLTGIKGRQLGYPVQDGHFRFEETGPLVLSETIEEEGIYEYEQKVSEALRPFYEKLFKKAGITRPDYLDSR